MIERYQILRSGEIWGYAPTEAEAFEKIQRNHKAKKGIEWVVHDLQEDVKIGTAGAVSDMERKQYITKRKKPSPPKPKKNDVIDDEYSKWLGRQKCVVTGQEAPRGAGAYNIHCHHIHGRGRGRNDYAQVPLMGFAHSWGGKAYHNMTREAFKAHYGLIVDDVVEYFEECAASFYERYLKEMQNKQ